ncbi:U7 snRNA-associated Sm-like protein LSm11 [Centrocercus urophasianus]|uniref:U7 snRNA-associated Sm-like protein LSm11 n=1 Tax=Centrocercus urophasianus TaxID=9002 RepID=UPI001C64F459|nr:U7 snRNA-associated Sm-like protein LSm11 [Centrocercus urophasianus]
MEEDEGAAGGAEQRHPRRRPGAERSPSPSRLDVSSSRFDPLLALYSADTPLPFPSAPCFNNLAEYESFQRGLLRQRGRRGPSASRGPSAGRSARRGPPASDPERIQRLRSLMVNAGPEQDAAGGGTARRRRAPRNVLTRMPLHEGSPLGELHRCVRDGVKINVHIRTFKGLRGVCTGFLVAFDKFWNMALTDVDETYRKPVLGKAFYAEPQLSLTRLFDRLKLQDASVKKGADSKTVSGELALTNDSQTPGWKVGSGRGREEDELEKQKRLGRGGEKKVPGDSLHLAVRGEADVGSGTAHTGGAAAGGTHTRSQARRKRRPKVDYQQVFTRHINQIFIRGENVLLVHLAH